MASGGDEVLRAASPDMPGDRWYDVVCEEKRLGLKFNGIEVTTIFDNSWAQRAGIEIDDEIHLVNGQKFYTMTREKKLEVLQGPRPLLIKLKRPEIKDAYYSLTLNELKLGMGFKGARIINVSPEGWAERSGVIVGDEIVEIAGTGFFSLTDDQKIDLFKRPRPFDIRFKRPARTRKSLVAKLGVDALVMPEKAPKREVAQNRVATSGGGLFECFCCQPTTDTTNDIEVSRRRSAFACKARRTRG
ncbi:unnamed protein product [Amoebophrya sp. A25]|nr:unnamed protein product [Amoebophrya sp. A25]|eukprot:GSA25T00005231001.1